MKKCIDCIHWEGGQEPYQGHCLVSLECLNTPAHNIRFTPYSEVKPISEIRLKEGGDNRVTGRMMSNYELIKASSNRRYVPPYPDMRQLTDESKKELRRRKVIK